MLINVILAIDERLDDVKRCVESLQKTYGSTAPIAFATYGGVAIGPQPATAAFAEVMGFPYLDIPRQDFLTEDDSKEWHACELLARIQITKHFADLGYSEIYIMHADVQVLKDFRPFFHKLTMDDSWSFVAILLRAQESFSDLCEKGSWRLYFEGNRARLADILVRYNPSFVGQICQNGMTPRELWQTWLSKFTLWGDLAQFDVAKPWKGFHGRFLHEKHDFGPMLGGSIQHKPREAVPACLSEGTRKGLDRAGILKNYERRAT
jgi:hypothetical protein